MSETMKKRARLVIVCKEPREGDVLENAHVLHRGFILEVAEEEPIQAVERIGTAIYHVETANKQYLAVVTNFYEAYNSGLYIARLPELPGGQSPLKVLRPKARVILERVVPGKAVRFEKVITSPIEEVYNVFGGEVFGVWAIETVDEIYYVQNN